MKESNNGLETTIEIYIGIINENESGVFSFELPSEINSNNSKNRTKTFTKDALESEIDYEVSITQAAVNFVLAQITVTSGQTTDLRVYNSTPKASSEDISRSNSILPGLNTS